MKINIIQPNVVTGALKQNADKILNFVNSAKDEYLHVVPSEALCGPQSQCFQKQPDFKNAFRNAIDYLCKHLDPRQALLCGASTGQPILIKNGFYAVMPVSFFYDSSKIYVCPANVQYCRIMADCDIIIDMHSRNMGESNQKRYEHELSRAAWNSQCWAISANLAGGYGNLVYNGQSLAIDPCGRIAARGAAFTEDSLFIDTESDYATIVIPSLPEPLEAEWQALVLGTRDFTHKAGFKSAIIGLSGGMDSALVACIAVDALGSENVSAIMMPSPYTSAESLADAKALAQNLGISLQTLPVEPLMNSFSQTLAPAFEKIPDIENDLTMENLQARIRGVLLMAIANKSGALVLNTGNKSELAMGYNTLYGDTAGALAVIGDVFKTRVYELARWRYGEKQIIPLNIFNKSPSAELRPNQKDTDSLPPYDRLDRDLATLLKQPAQEKQLSPELLKLRQKVFAFRFKRAQCPPALLVSETPLDQCPNPFNSAYNVDFEE